MLDIKLIREKPEWVKERLSIRGVDIKKIDQVLDLDIKRREFIASLDKKKGELNRVSAAYGETKDEKLKEQASKLKQDISKDEPGFKIVDNEFWGKLRELPNTPLDFVPMGQSEADNKVVKEWGEKPKIEVKDYLSLTEPHLIDIERAAKVSGTRFGYIKGELAQLEFALVRFAFDELFKEGFIPIVPPVLVKKEMMEGMGYVDTKSDEQERYFLEKDNLYLVGTSEQSIGPMYQGEILEEKVLPLRYVAFSTCFRREAGSYGKDTKGILRVHQFDKVEMFSFAKPEDSQQEHKFLLKQQENLMQALELPYRVVSLCTADLAQPSAATYDIEAWMPGQNQYRETNSVSNTTDFQSRRLNIRYKDNNQSRFVHMLNGTAFAIGRILIAIVENYQTKEGGIKIPKVLQRYLTFKEIKPHK